MLPCFPTPGHPLAPSENLEEMGWDRLSEMRRLKEVSGDRSFSRAGRGPPRTRCPGRARGKGVNRLRRSGSERPSRGLHGLDGSRELRAAGLQESPGTVTCCSGRQTSPRRGVCGIGLDGAPLEGGSFPLLSCLPVPRPGWSLRVAGATGTGAPLSPEQKRTAESPARWEGGKGAPLVRPPQHPTTAPPKTKGRGCRWEKMRLSFYNHLLKWSICWVFAFSGHGISNQRGLSAPGCLDAGAERCIVFAVRMLET